MCMRVCTGSARRAFISAHTFRHKHERHVRRGIIRHVFVIVDLSTAMDDKEFKPTYMEVAVAYLKQFVVEFFDQNPIAQLGFIGTKDGLATKLSELSGMQKWVLIEFWR